MKFSCWMSLVVLAGCAGGSNEGTLGQSICGALTDCGALPAAEESYCAAEINAALPAGEGQRAAQECSACYETKTCSDIGAGMCSATCAPLKGALSATPGTLQLTFDDGSPACMRSSTLNYAEAGTNGVRIHLECGERVTVTAPNLAVGAPVSCAVMQEGPSDGLCTVTGSVTMEVRNGMRWVVGNCGNSCDQEKTTFNVPYRLFN